MKVAFLTSRYPGKDNPYNHMFVHMRCVEMIKQGYEVSVYVPSKIFNTYVFEGVEVIQMPSKELNKELHQYNVLYLHLLNIYPFTKENGWPIYKYILKNNLSFVMYIHGNDVQKYGSRMFEFRFNHTELLKWVKRDTITIPRIKRFVTKTKKKSNVAFIFPSVWMKEDMEHNLQLKVENNFHIIPNGINTKLLSFHKLYKNRYKLVTLRPLSSKKYAVDIAIDIMKYLPEKYTLEIFGKGQYEKSYRDLIKANGLKERVNIKNNFIERSELNNFFTQYGIMLAPTRMDAQGVSMCEAMSSGLLTVSSDNTAIPEFITHLENGIIGKEPKKIAEEIIRVVNNEERYNQIVLKGRESMEAIDINKTVSKELEVLKKVSSING
ncbi:glycosyltransferase involved in cell wall biosynthesis [Maribacter caenipelagi]|uniref:Glycosyltransferase involved in cell wall biosynthesis n=1 Tax=Maribacter caenipelagi TaxID=1447781 RepID=A0A4R7DBA1_9FLAO|nr:glycosyltransferase family 4 protein [Maribacter caenipelagi]TDS18649.1 glycosyltransferase involved in cell wall biosynthesis [Maribacter caenipelagi]